MESLGQDIRYGIRNLAQNPGFTAVAVLSLALGIGANTAIFTVTNAMFLSAIPVHDPARLVLAQTSDRSTRSSDANLSLTPISPANFRDFRAQNDVFSDLAGFMQGGITLTGRGDPRPLPMLLVSGNYFDTLGVAAVQGRTFTDREDQTPGANPVAVLSHSLWTNVFGADRELIGKTVNLGQTPFTVIGVTPPGFKGTFTIGNPDVVWIPMSMHAQVLSGMVGREFNNRRLRALNVFGRLKPGVEMSQADAAMKTIAARLEKEYPFDNNGRTIVVSPLNDNALGQVGQRRQLVSAALALSAVVGLVLLIACFNLANMLLARAARREKEMSIRTALGAQRWRLARQLLTENLLLAAAGGAGGLAFAAWGRDILWSFRPPFLTANAVDLRFDPNVLWFAVGVSFVTSLVFGAVPALRASSPDLNDVLKSAGRGNSASSGGRLRGALVVSQVALTVIALAGAGLFIRSLRNAQAIDPGFESQNLFALGLDLGPQQWPAQRTAEFQRAVAEKLRSVPGIDSVAMSTVPPLAGGFMRTVLKQGQESEANPRGHLIVTNYVSPDFFNTMRIPLRDGRVFTDFDRADTTAVVVINEQVARLFWPGENPIGRKLYFISTPVMRQVVGVAANAVQTALGESPQPALYLPLAQEPSPFVAVLVRTKIAPDLIMPAALAEVQRMNSSLALGNSRTIQQVIGQGLWAPRMGAALFGIFGALGLTLAALGIYGVMAYTVAQRTNEIGIRMALGARPGDVRRMVVNQSMRLALIGIVLGLAGALAVSRWMSALLFNVSPADPVTFTIVSAVLAAAAALAAWIPALRASRIDPVIALRE